MILTYVSYSCLESLGRFIYTQRSADCLPKEAPSDMERISYFLDDYKHPKVSDPNASLSVHISYALKQLHINDVT